MAIETLESPGTPELPADRLIAVLAQMATARSLDDKFTQLQRRGVLPFYLSCKGYEGVGVAIAHALAEKDWLFPGFRDLAAVLARGVPLARIAHQVFGTQDAPSKGRVLPIYQIHRDWRVASSSAGGVAHLVHAVGWAWASKLRRDSAVALASFAGGGAASGEFHAALNFAAVFAAPVVFVCESQEPQSIVQLAASYGMPATRVDSGDVPALLATSSLAVQRARSGQGPAMIEVGLSVDPGDPIAQLSKLLVGRGIRLEPGLGAREADIQSALDQARQAAPPGQDTLLTDVFAPLPRDLLSPNPGTEP